MACCSGEKIPFPERPLPLPAADVLAVTATCGALPRQAPVELIWDSLIRSLKSTGTIIWVIVGAAALSGAYTRAGGPVYMANLIVGSDMPTMAS